MADRLEIQSVTKTFPHAGTPVRAVDNVSLSIRGNEFFTLLGPSGCGKTTLLRLIAGLEIADSGKIILGEQDITDLPAHKRPVNTVFQSYALFPHMTVAENIAFGMKMQKKNTAEIEEAVKKSLRLIRLDQMAERKPAQLSGGQQQRVALARALVNKPKALLLDESLSALDYKLRKDMQVELKRLQQETGITFIFVTHDQDEALSMSDRIAVMDHGKVVQLGSPQEVYDTPATRFVADFIGTCNFVKGSSLGLPDDAEIGFRPEDTYFMPDPGSGTPKPGTAAGHIAHITYRGDVTHYLIKLDRGETVTMADDDRIVLRVNDRIFIRTTPEYLIRCRA